MSEINELRRANQKELEQRFSVATDISPIEHMLIGSGVPVNGFLTNSQTVLPLLKSGELPSEFFFPFSAREKPDEIGNLIKRRTAKGFLKGNFIFLDVDVLVSLMQKKYSVCLKLPQLDEKTGRIEPKWNIHLYNESPEFGPVEYDENGETVTNPNRIIKEKKELEQIKLDSEFNEVFSLGFNTEDDLILKLKD